MCPADDSHLTLEFDDHFVITPTIKFVDRVQSYKQNLLGEVGQDVPEGFEYHSGSNPHFMSPEEIRVFNESAYR
ncbi:UDP-N-acetylglucosamine 4,6-dehydratase [compost metagenome]